MTKLLEDAIARVQALPPNKQNEVAWVILDFIGSEVVDLSRLPSGYRKTVEASLLASEADGRSLGPNNLRALYRSLV